MIKITEVPCQCNCGWSGTVYDCEPDIDGDGSLGCPNCDSIIEVVVPAPTNFWTNRKVIVTGGSGFLGSHLCHRLAELGCSFFVPRSELYDLRVKEETERMFLDALRVWPVDMVIHLAGNVGGIGYNRNFPYQLFFDNAIMGLNLIDCAIRHGVGKFVQVGTVCSYPKWGKCPLSEHELWYGYPEETNAPYGLAKKILLVQLQAARAELGFNGIYLLPTNLYGPGDEFNPARSHVIPALIRKCIEARNQNLDQIEVWGTGEASRDFLYVGDAVEAILLAAEKYNRPEPLNLGSGQEIRIVALIHHIAELTGYKGKITWDTSKPDGQPRRVLDTRLAKQHLGWIAQTPFRDGLKQTIDWYEKQQQAEVINA